MKRRDFLRITAAATASWPVVAGAQHGERVRRIGVLFPFHEGDIQAATRLKMFETELNARGWIPGRNLMIDVRWGGGDASHILKLAEELVALAPDAIMATGGATVGPLLQVNRTVPIVFVRVTDPVGAGYVQSLARPGGNATGFAIFEYGTSTKWLQLLAEIAPHVRRVAVLRDLNLPSGAGQLSELEKAAHSFGLTIFPIDVGDERAIDSGLEVFARSSNGGVIVVTSALATVHRKLIIALCARHRLPAVYPFRYFASEGGLLFYGPDTVSPYRNAGEYVHRVLSGEKPADLPVQAQTKFELVINLKTAKVLGLEVPSKLLFTADEVIE